MDGKVWFTADPHLGHEKIIKFCDRPFDSVEKMNRAIIDNWNAVVDEKDFVFLLGDVAYGRADRMYGWMEELRGRIGLILGNHDKGVAKGRCGRRFEWVKDLYETYIPDSDAPGNRQKIVMCHYPLLTWNKSSKGSWMLHGHCHGNLHASETAFRMDVGVDLHDFTPITYEQVKKFMSTKRFEAVDHHGEDDDK